MIRCVLAVAVLLFTSLTVALPAQALDREARLAEASAAYATALAEPDRVRGLVLAAPPSPAGVSARAVEFADAIERDGLEAAGAKQYNYQTARVQRCDAG